MVRTWPLFKAGKFSQRWKPVNDSLLLLSFFLSSASHTPFPLSPLPSPPFSLRHPPLDNVHAISYPIQGLFSSSFVPDDARRASTRQVDSCCFEGATTSQSPATMSLFAWCSRRAGGLSMLALLGLCYWVISQESTLQRHGFKSERPGAPGASYSSTSGAGIWTFVFAYYCLLIHVLVFLFPLRACWSVWDITQALRRSAQTKALENFKMGLRRRGSSTSISSSETLTSDTLTSDSNAYSSTVSEASDVEPELYTDNADADRDPVIHAIIIPNYKEEMDTLKETLDVLASHPQAHLSYDVSHARKPSSALVD